MPNRIGHTRAFILTLALAATTATTTSAQDTTTPPAAAQQAKAAMDTLGAATGKPDSTSGSFTGTLDLTAIGQPGGTVPFSGSDRSEMILGGTGRITVVTSMGQTTINYLGYRTDTKQYYTISMDAENSALAYAAGTLTGPKTLTLTDPISRISSETTFTETGATSTVRVPPKNAVMMTIESTASTTPGGDVLEELLSTTVIPAANVRTASPEALALRKLAGDFTDGKGDQVRARTIGNGNYVLTQFSGDDTLSFITYNPETKLFQMFMLQAGRPAPLYLQGPLTAKGAIEFADPFTPGDQQMKATISFEPSGVINVVSAVGSRVGRTTIWTPKRTN